MTTSLPLCCTGSTCCLPCASLRDVFGGAWVDPEFPCQCCECCPCSSLFTQVQDLFFCHFTVVVCSANHVISQLLYRVSCVLLGGNPLQVVQGVVGLVPVLVVGLKSGWDRYANKGGQY